MRLMAGFVIGFVIGFPVFVCLLKRRRRGLK